MAKSENNEVMFGARGKVGNLVVFKNFGENQTIIAKRRKKIVNPKYTIEQEKTKEKFRDGVVYAKSAIAGPVLAAMYSRMDRPGISAYNLALADFCKAPEIKVIDLSAYKGVSGDVIKVRAIDNFRVAKVMVSVFTSSGTLVETGAAIQHPNGLDWAYTSTLANAALSGSYIRAEAYDVSGNLTVEEIGMD